MRGLPAFRYETGDSASSHLNSGPRPGRELRRIPPPLSPVYPATPAAAAAIAKRLGTLPPATSSSPDIPLPPTAIASVISSSPRLPQGDKTSSPGPAAESAPAADEITPRSHPAPSDSLRLSSAAEKPHSYSSNGVVPDSEGPTQDEGQAPAAAARPSPRRASAAPAQAVEPVVDDSMDVDDDRGAQDDYGGGGEEETEQALPEKVPTHEPGPATIAVAAATKKSPSKSKKTAPRAHKTSPSKRDKGKGRAVEPGSPDELDCFQPTQSHADRYPPLPLREDVESEPMLETNYEEPPGLDNSKRPSPKKRKVSGAPPTVSPASTVARKRRASELEPVVEIPVSTKRVREPVTKKAALKKPKGKASARGKAKAKGAATSAGGKKRGRSRKLVSSSESEGSPSSEEEDEAEEQRVPVAGPSRLRFDSVDEIMPDVSRASTGPSEQGGKPNVGGRKSKLPASAPFTRVFGLWRDDGWIYPGTIVGVSGGRVDVVFDDESKGKLLFEELRRCELKRGDYIRYRGTEIDTETQAETLARDLRVYRVESGVDGSDVEGHLQSQDVVVATKVDVAFEDQSKEGDRCQRLNVEGIAIVSEHVAQLDDRKLTPAEIAAFAPPSAKAIKPLTLLNHPPPTVLESVAVNRKLGIFSRMAFLITSTPASGTDSEKAAFVKLLEEHGGTVLEIAHLFTVKTLEKGGDSTLEFARRSGLDKIDFILLLAERPCTTSKYLVALSLGIPCVSSRFVYNSIQDVSPAGRRCLSAQLTSRFDRRVLGSNGKTSP